MQKLLYIYKFLVLESVLFSIIIQSSFYVKKCVFNKRYTRLRQKNHDKQGFLVSFFILKNPVLAKLGKTVNLYSSLSLPKYDLYTFI